MQMNPLNGSDGNNLTNVFSKMQYMMNNEGLTDDTIGLRSRLLVANSTIETSWFSFYYLCQGSS